MTEIDYIIDVYILLVGLKALGVSWSFEWTLGALYFFMTTSPPKASLHDRSIMHIQCDSKIWKVEEHSEYAGYKRNKEERVETSRNRDTHKNPQNNG